MEQLLSTPEVISCIMSKAGIESLESTCCKLYILGVGLDVIKDVLDNRVFWNERIDVHLGLLYIEYPVYICKQIDLKYCIGSWEGLLNEICTMDLPEIFDQVLINSIVVDHVDVGVLLFKVLTSAITSHSERVFKKILEDHVDKLPEDVRTSSHLISLTMQEGTAEMVKVLTVVYKDEMIQCMMTASSLKRDDMLDMLIENISEYEKVCQQISMLLASMANIDGGRVIYDCVLHVSEKLALKKPQV